MPSPARVPLQITLGVIKPSVAAHQPHVQEIMQRIKSSGLEIVRSKRLHWRPEEAEEFYAEHHDRFYFPRLVSHATSSPFVALALAAPDAIKRWRTLIGPTKVFRGQWEDGSCLRARYGTSDTRNGFHGSDSPESAAKELGQVFPDWDVRWVLEQREKAEV